MTRYQQVNSKPARRWRNVAFCQNSKNYELECKVSDRVAIVYAKSSPYHWGIFGWPNENGISHISGKSSDLLTAKREARKALDGMVVQ